MRLEIYNPLGELKRIVSTASSSQWSRELMGDDMVSASWTDTECIPLQVDDHIRLQGQTYSIQQEYHPTKKHDGEYAYRVNFYAPLHLASRVMYLNLTDGQYNPEFSLDDSPRAHLQKWVDNMRRRPGAEPWCIGTVIDAPNKNIVYNKVDCLQAGRLMAEAFETELWADGHTINLCPCERGERVNLGYRQGLTSLTRTEGSRRTKFFTRLLPLGSTRNIQATAYGAKRLQLPHGRKYVERNTHLGLIEHVEETAFAHIYPRYVGTVSGVRTQQRRSPEGKEYTVYHFSDSHLGFNPSEHKVPGLTMQVSFISGELNGRDFEVEYSPARGEWEIINTYPDEHTQLPGGNLIPKAGDRYIPYNLRMPEVYITRAEQELEAAVQDYLGRYSQDISIYEGQTDYIHIRRQGVPLQPGQRVHLVSPEYFGEQGYDTRITRVVSKLDELSDATISCSSQVGRGWRSGLESSVNTLEYVLAKQREDSQVDVLRLGDEREVTDHRLLSALRTLREIQRRSLSRLQPDTATAHLTFAEGLTSAKVAQLLEGLTTADYVGGLTGRGAKIDKDGHAELDSLFVRKFIESSELRYNRVSVIQGEQWHAKGGGIIQSVDTEAKRLHLKLEAGELPTVAVGDLCKANYNTGTGFATCYFKVTSVTPEGVVGYELRPGYNLHPTPTMHFAAFGNTDDPTRQQSAYSTTGYTRYLRGVNDWEIGVDNIAMQLGDLSNLTVYGLQLEGYSAYLSNVYFTGLIAQIGQAVADKLPRINPATGTWMQWDEQAGRMVDSGIKAKGEDGRDGAKGDKGDTGARGERGEQGQKGADGRNGIDWGAGKMMYTDPAFAGGRNQTYPYGSLDTNLLLLERVPTGEGNPYPSTHMLRITSKGQCAPGWGGFYFATPTRANQILITRIVAKIPVGRSIAFGTNALTPGHTHRWLTPTAGTGGWQEYIYYVQQGTGGSYHKTNYFYLTGGATPTPAAPLVWHVAYATVYDATDVGPDYMAEITAKAGELKTYVDGAFADGMIDAAEARAIAKYINIVDTERATLEANYTKLYTNPRLTGVAKTTLLNTKVSWEGKVTALLSAIRTAIADGKTTAAEKNDVDAKYSAYRADTTNLHKALQDANKAVAVAEAVPKVEVIVDASALDPNKYYPVTIGRLLQNKAQTIRVWRDLNTTLYNVPSWSTHARGCTVYLEWMTNGSDWGVRTVDRRIITWQSIFSADNKPPVGDIGQIIQGSMEHCYVRGGSHYSVSIEGTTDAAITLHPQGYEWVSGTYRIPLPVRDYVSAPRVTAATKDDIPPTYLLPMPHDPAVTYIGGRNYAAVVYDSGNQWYKAIKDVPAGTPLTNRTYWQPISSMGSVGMQEAYVRSLWANQAFVDKLHAQSIMARSIKAGDNPANPQALIDEHGYGHLSGGALRFDADGLHMGAFDVDEGNVYIRDAAGNIRVRYSSEAPPPLAELSRESTFTYDVPSSSNELRQSFNWVMKGYGRGVMPADGAHSTLEFNTENWYRWVSDGVLYLDWFDIERLEAQLDIAVSAGVRLESEGMGWIYGCDVNVDLFKDMQMVRRLGTLRHTGSLVRSATLNGTYNVKGLTSGRYRLRLSFIPYVARQQNVYPVVILSASHSGGRLSYSGGGYRTIGFHDRAWYIAYPDIMLYMSEEEGFHLTSKNNKLNLPGVLCAARIGANGAASYAWGKFVNEVQRGKELRAPGVYRANDGTYTIRHGISHADYVPTVTPQNSGGAMVDMIAVNPYSFTFKMYNRHGNAISSAFHFQCVGSNG